MFRVSHLVVKASNLMLRRSPIEIRVAHLSRTSSLYREYKKPSDKERETCPVKPPPKEVPKDDRFFWGTIALLIVAGTFTVFAKSSPEVRDWLSIQAPWLDDFIAAVFSENRPLKDSAVDFFDSVADYVYSKFEPLPRECGGVVPVPPAVNEVKSDPEMDEALRRSDKWVPGPCNIGGDVKRTCSYIPPKTEHDVHDDDDDDDDDEDEDDDNEEALCTILEPPVVTKDPCEVERCLKELSDTVYFNYMTARDACIYYNKTVQSAMKDFSLKALRELKHEMETKKDLYKKHSEKAQKTGKIFENFARYVSCGVDIPKKRLDFTKNLIHDYERKLENMRIDAIIQYKLSKAYDEQWQQITEHVNTLIEQQKSLYGELDYDKETPEIQGNLDPLLLLTKKYVDKLTADVVESRAVNKSKSDAAFTVVTMKDKDKELNNAVNKAKAEMNKDFAEREKELRARLENERKTLLEQSKKKQDQSLEHKVQSRTQQFEKSFDKKVAEKVAIEKKKFDLDLDEMREKVEMVEYKLKERLKAECESKRAQKLYDASSSLLKATKKGDPRVKVDTQLKEIKRLATEEDKLVKTVLDSIPGTVWKEGVVPESVLRDKFLEMEDVARKVALLEAEGGPLPLYAMSWLQSALLFMRPTTIPQKEIDQPLEEPYEGLDTFDILQRARYFVEQGNIAKAVRYVDSLEGASRGAADAWYNAATEYVQTRQAAEALLAHAAAMNGKYI